MKQNSWRKEFYTLLYSIEQFRDEVCRKTTKVYRRSKTLRCRSDRCNCKWIDSLETPVKNGGRRCNIRKTYESLRQQDREDIWIHINIFIFVFVHGNILVDIEYPLYLFIIWSSISYSILSGSFEMLKLIFLRREVGLNNVECKQWFPRCSGQFCLGCAIYGADHGGWPAAYGAPRSVTDPEASPCAEMDDPEWGRGRRRNFQFCSSLYCSERNDRYW